MLETSHSEKRLREFSKLYREGRLNLEPAFQRRSVWTKRDRQRLVTSVFDGIPLPSVYLYKRIGEAGFVEYDVIDGKQRLESLLLFAGEGPLVASEPPLRFRGDLDGRLPEALRSWEELVPALRKEFRNTKLPVITVSGELREVAELFVRINSTGKKLTGQEKRHAFYEHSNVLRVATKLAEDHRAYFVGHRIFSLAQMSRMAHIEFATELMLYAASHTHPNKKQKLDGIIKGELIDGPQCKQAAAEVGQALKVAVVLLPDLKTTRFKQRADFYTLVCGLIQTKAEGQVVTAHDAQRNDLAGELLRGFALGVEEVSELSGKAKPIPPGYGDHTNYLMTVKEGTDSATQRQKRAKILIEAVLAGVFDEQDVQRKFSAQQRRILWHRSLDKTCAICARRITKWEDMHADHVQAYVKGGKTTLGNGAITHKHCNQRKGAK